MTFQEGKLIDEEERSVKFSVVTENLFKESLQANKKDFSVTSGIDVKDNKFELSLENNKDYTLVFKDIFLRNFEAQNSYYGMLR